MRGPSFAPRSARIVRIRRDDLGPGLFVLDASAIRTEERLLLGSEVESSDGLFPAKIADPRRDEEVARANLILFHRE